MAKIKIYEIAVFEYNATSKVETQTVMKKVLYAETVVQAYQKFVAKITLSADQFIGAIRLLATIDEEFNPGA